MLVTVFLEAAEAPCGYLKISQVEFRALAAIADQHITRNIRPFAVFLLVALCPCAAPYACAFVTINLILILAVLCVGALRPPFTRQALSAYFFFLFCHTLLYTNGLIDSR